MRCGILLVISGWLVAALLLAGCADVSATQKVGDFGTAFGASADEQKAIDWFRQTYGDPTTNNGQPARFVEPLITTGLSDMTMPKDKVVTFPQSGGSVYFFVIYDNFKKGDPITVSWTYLENGREVTKVEKQAGGDFGRFIVEFQKPDSGWGKGMQKLTISGDGATASVDFTIGDTLATTPLPYNPATATVTTVTVTTSRTTVPSTCSSGLTLCSGTCRDLASDQDNCGACGYGCDPEIGLVCRNGMCVRGSVTTTQVTTIPTPSDTLSCDPPLYLCYDRCTDLNTDNNNCGRCGFPCESNSGTTSTCASGQCQVSCKSGYADCDGNKNNGCEVRTMTDTRHCGACGKVCSQTNGVGLCENGACKITCNPGFGNCDGNLNNGCEVNTNINTMNCGGCGNVCSQAQTNGVGGCTSGVCKLYCNAGYSNCNGQLSDGCEVNVLTDIRNCGSCGNWCPRRASDNAIPYCTQGQCTY